MNHREMKALADNADAVRALAQYLLKLPERDAQVVWTDWELDFLDSMARHAGPDPLSMRQVEVLAELRDAARSYDRLDGMAVPRLIAQVWQARLDLEEADEAFIDGLKRSGARSVKRRQAAKLIACARQLGIVDHYVALDRSQAL